MRNMPDARACFSASPPKPGAKIHISSGAARTPTTVVTHNQEPRTAAVCSTRAPVSSRLRCSRYSDNTGTNAWEKPPSAKIRRKKFGMRNATINASTPAPGPNMAPIRTSRANPRIRDNVVIRPTTRVDLSSFSFID